MSDEISCDPMPVRRVETGGGSHIEPPLDQRWSEHDKLRWNAGVMLADTGIAVRVTPMGRRFGSRTYALTARGVGLPAQPYREAWRTISNLSTGARMAQKGAMW